MISSHQTIIMNVMKRTLVFFTILFVYYVIATPMNFWVLTKRQFFSLLVEYIVLWYLVRKWFPYDDVYVRVMLTVFLTALLAYPVLRWITPPAVNLLKNTYIISAVFILSVLYIHSIILGGLSDAIMITIILLIVSLFVMCIIWANSKLSKDSSIVMMSSFLANPIIATLLTVWVTWSIMLMIHESTFSFQ